MKSIKQNLNSKLDLQETNILANILQKQNLNSK